VTWWHLMPAGARCQSVSESRTYFGFQFGGGVNLALSPYGE